LFRNLPNSHTGCDKFSSRCIVTQQRLKIFLFCYTGTQVTYSHLISPSANVIQSSSSVDLSSLLFLDGVRMAGGWVEDGFGIASSTRSTYSSAQRRFLDFCSCSGLSPLPISEHTLCLYAAFLANEGLARQVISTYLSTLRHYQISASLPPLQAIFMAMAAVRTSWHKTNP
jgi:hypothetical protein